MIVWEEIDEWNLRARAGYNRDGVYHSWDARFYATVAITDSGSTWLVEWYAEHRDRETNELITIRADEGDELDVSTAQLAVEATIYRYMANETQSDYLTARLQDGYQEYLQMESLLQEGSD